MNRNSHYRNGEGYTDNTAGAAITRAARAEKRERKDIMAKRSCRRTKEENKIHEKAVKMRKMTDEQLVHYVENRVEKARSEGFNQGKKKAPAPMIDLTGIIDELSAVKGIGAVKMKQIKIILEDRIGVYAKCE